MSKRTSPNQSSKPSRRFIVTALGALLGQGIASPAIAGGPSDFFKKIFHRKQAITEESLNLKPEHGPWLIFAAAIPGEGAKQNAVALAKELQTTLGLPTFVMQKTFDSSGVLGSTSQVVPDLDGGRTQYRAWTQYANGSREQVYAVLVGEFSTMEDPKVEGALKAIRLAQPQTFQNLAARDENDILDSEGSNAFLQKYRSWLTSGNKKVGPMGTAFLTKNPLLPDEFFLDSPKVDSFVVDLNKNVKYSLLDCDSKYTVRVASFTGKEVTDFGNGARASQMPGKISNALELAAYKANKLTTALRKEKVEAYEFHDRYGSYVTIGGFDSLGQQLADGQFKYNSTMEAVMKKYCGYRNLNAKDPITGAMMVTTSVNSLDKVPFDIQGKPIAVPRKAPRTYGGSLLGRR